MKAIAIALFLAGLACVAPAVASTSAQNLDVDSVVAEQQQIRGELEAGHYRNLSQAERGEILERQARVLSLLGQTEQLSEEARLGVLAEVDWIHAKLDRAGKARMICTRERRTGSQRVQRVCRSEEEIRLERKGSQEGMRTLPRTQLKPLL